MKVKMKTADLIGTALDWAVAVSEGAKWEENLLVWHDEESVRRQMRPHPYSSDWAYAGEIIVREDITFRKYHRPDSDAHGKYYARICRESGTMVGWYKTTGFQQTGPTPLVAAARCFVASRLGDEVEVPQALLS